MRYAHKMTLAPLREPGRFDTAESGGFPIIYEKSPYGKYELFHKL